MYIIQAQVNYSYMIKILKKKKPVTKELHNINGKFKSIEDMKHVLEGELKERITGDLGYFKGRQSAKRWLTEEEDLVQMYDRQKKGEIHLWCSFEEDEIQEPPKKKKKESGCSRREDKERNADKIFEELLQIHQEKYTKPQLKLWARMLVNDIHDSYDDPPNVPMINGNVSKIQKKETLSEIIAGAATTFVKAMCPPTSVPPPVTTTTTSCKSPVSPGKSASVRMKNLEQLRYLQQLFKDNILTENEYMEQKASILEALRAL